MSLGSPNDNNVRKRFGVIHGSSASRVAVSLGDWTGCCDSIDIVTPLAASHRLDVAQSAPVTLRPRQCVDRSVHLRASRGQPKFVQLDVPDEVHVQSADQQVHPCFRDWSKLFKQLT